MKQLVEYDPIALDAKTLGELPGTYVVSPEMTVEIFANDGRLFVSAPGRPELLILPYQADRFFARSIQFLLEVERGTTDEILAIRATLQGRPMRGVRSTPGKPEAVAPSASGQGSE